MEEGEARARAAGSGERLGAGARVGKEGRRGEKKEKKKKKMGKEKEKKGREKGKKREMERDSRRKRGARSATRGAGHAWAVGRDARVKGEQGGLDTAVGVKSLEDREIGRKSLE